MKITIYELLGLVKDGKAPKKIEYDGNIWEFNKDFNQYQTTKDGGNIWNGYNFNVLNDTVEILKKDKKDEEKELHANDIKFNINTDKIDCVITLDENDLGIDKLHIDNCYFYKENGKWYIHKLKNVSFAIEEEKKIPEKLEIEQDTPNSNYYIRNEYGTKCYLTKHSKIIADKINEVIDYLNSKGDK